MADFADKTLTMVKKYEKAVLYIIFSSV